MTLCRSLLLAILATLACTASAAAARHPGGMTGQTCVYGSVNPIPLSQMQLLDPGPGGWQCNETSADLENRHVWTRFDTVALPQGRDISLTGDAGAFDGLRYYIEFADQPPRSATLDAADIARAWLPQTRFGIPLYSAEENPVRVYVRIDGALTTATVNRLELEPAETVATAKLNGAVLFAFFLGVMALAGFYSAAIFGSLKNRFAVWHIVLSSLFVGYTLSSGSLIFMVWPDLGLFTRTAISYASLSLAVASIVPFILTFVNARHIRPLYRNLLIASAILLVANALLMPLFGRSFPFVIRPIYHFAFLPAFIMFAVIIVDSWRVGGASIRWIAAAWTVPALFGVERIARGTNLYQGSYRWDHAVYYALAYMAVVIAMAVAWRVSDLRRQRDEAVAKEAELNQQAYADALTGLPNRRAFDAREWRSGDFLAILDLDRFKQVNDLHGHQTGDDVLRSVGQTLLAASADARVVGSWRLGGEEFAILVDAANAPAAALLLNEVRARLTAEVATALPGMNTRVTVSIGMARLGSDGIAAAYRQADKALYHAKEAGRDRLSFEDEHRVLATMFAKRAAA